MQHAYASLRTDRTLQGRTAAACGDAAAAVPPAWMTLQPLQGDPACPLRSPRRRGPVPGRARRRLQATRCRRRLTLGRKKPHRRPRTGRGTAAGPARDGTVVQHRWRRRRRDPGGRPQAISRAEPRAAARVVIFSGLIVRGSAEGRARGRRGRAGRCRRRGRHRSPAAGRSGPARCRGGACIVPAGDVHTHQSLRHHGPRPGGGRGGGGLPRHARPWWPSTGPGGHPSSRSFSTWAVARGNAVLPLWPPGKRAGSVPKRAASASAQR